MSQDPADHNPFASPESPEPEPFSQARQSSLALTAVAVLNYLMGTMTLMCGGCIAVVAPHFAIPEDGGDPTGIEGGMIVVFGVVLIFLSLPVLLAGYGIQRRKQWGRVLTIILATLSGILAISHIVRLNPQAISLVYGGYTVFVLFILLRPKYAAEFRGSSPRERE